MPPWPMCALGKHLKVQQGPRVASGLAAQAESDGTLNTSTRDEDKVTLSEVLTLVIRKYNGPLTPNPERLFKAILKDVTQIKIYWNKGDLYQATNPWGEQEVKLGITKEAVGSQPTSQPAKKPASVLTLQVVLSLLVFLSLQRSLQVVLSLQVLLSMHQIQLLVLKEQLIWVR
nr:hypothetical protein [Tanacetum cinerariifolium]